MIVILIAICSVSPPLSVSLLSTDPCHCGDQWNIPRCFGASYSTVRVVGPPAICLQGTVARHRRYPVAFDDDDDDVADYGPELMKPKAKHNAE